MRGTYHLRVREDFAAKIIEDLIKKEAVEDIPEEEAFPVPQWQQDLVMGRIEDYKAGRAKMLDEATFYKMLDEDE